MQYYWNETLVYAKPRQVHDRFVAVVGYAISANRLVWVVREHHAEDFSRKMPMGAPTPITQYLLMKG